MSVKTGHFSHVFHMVFHIHTPSSAIRELGWEFPGWDLSHQKVIGSTPVGSQTRILFFWAACVAD